MKYILTIFASIVMSTVTYAQLNIPQGNTPNMPNLPQGNLPYGTVRKLPLMAMCGSVENLSAKLRQYNEIPMVHGKAALEVPNAGLLEGRMTLYMNPQTKSFTYIFYLQPPMVPNPMGIEACIQSVGKEIMPAYMN